MLFIEQPRTSDEERDNAYCIMQAIKDADYADMAAQGVIVETDRGNYALIGTRNSILYPIRNDEELTLWKKHVQIWDAIIWREQPTAEQSELPQEFVLKG